MKYWNEIVYIAMVKKVIGCNRFYFTYFDKWVNYIEGRVFNHPLKFVSMALYMIYITYMIVYE
jgi:hypothetical protein